MKNIGIWIASILGFGLLFGASIQIHQLSFVNFQAFFVIGACIGWWLPSCANPKDFKPMLLVDLLVGVLSAVLVSLIYNLSLEMTVALAFLAAFLSITKRFWIKHVNLPI